MTWIMGTATAILAWLLWYYRPRPAPETERSWTDPFAAQIAEFRRQVNDYSRG